MSDTVLVALLADTVAIVTLVISMLISLKNLQLAREKWLPDLTATLAQELYKERLAAYPEFFAIVQPLSHRADEDLTPERAREVGRRLNNWFYSRGGLCAEDRTRGAIRGLRNSCDRHDGTKEHRKEIRAFRNYALQFARLDLNLKGLESFDEWDDPKTLLARLEQETKSVRKQERTRVESALPRKHRTLSVLAQRLPRSKEGLPQPPVSEP